MQYFSMECPLARNADHLIPGPGLLTSHLHSPPGLPSLATAEITVQ